MAFEPTYQGARIVAPAVEEHFARHFAEAQGRHETEIAPKPDREAIERMIDTAFWASLRKEEGYSPKISLAFLPPEKAKLSITFDQRMPLTAKGITKLAPAVERPGIHLGVWQDKEGIHLWGATRDLPPVCFVVEVVEPGMLVVKHRKIHGFGKFFNVAILKGDQIKLVDESKAKLSDSPAILTSMLSFAPPPSWNVSINVLVQLAASMRAHGRGGILLVVPSGTDAWLDSLIQPIQYAVFPPDSSLAELMRLDLSHIDPLMWRGALNQAVNALAGLTAVDGATLINDKYELLAFGAKIGRSDKGTRIERIVATEPVAGNTAEVLHPGQNGGTRHLSAAQFVHDQRDAIALVASQDGKFTIFAWSEREGMVHAHRVDALLL